MFQAFALEPGRSGSVCITPSFSCSVCITPSFSCSVCITSSSSCNAARLELTGPVALYRPSDTSTAETTCCCFGHGNSRGELLSRSDGDVVVGALVNDDSAHIADEQVVESRWPEEEACLARDQPGHVVVHDDVVVAVVDQPPFGAEPWGGLVVDKCDPEL